MNNINKKLNVIHNKTINEFASFFLLLVILSSVGCNDHNNSLSFTSQNDNASIRQTQTPTETQDPIFTPVPTAIQTDFQATEAAKIAADFDDTGAPYFIAYEYDASYYLVSAYETQHGIGNYSGGGELYLVNRATGKVDINTDIDFDKVDFSKYITVYSKLSSRIIEDNSNDNK